MHTPSIAQQHADLKYTFQGEGTSILPDQVAQQGLQYLVCVCVHVCVCVCVCMCVCVCVCVCLSASLSFGSEVVGLYVHTSGCVIHVTKV